MVEICKTCWETIYTQLGSLNLSIHSWSNMCGDGGLSMGVEGLKHKV